MPYGVPMSWMASLWDHPPIFVAEGRGATFADVDGHTYLDFHIADTSAFCGHAPEPVTRAVAEQAARGAQFQLPTEDALWVAAELARRWGLPRWQFTLSATTANVEAIRLARHATGRDTVLMFDGKYHGHGDDTLVILEGDRSAPEYLGLPAHASRRARIVQFNDLDALARALEPEDVACVLAEPAMTNLTIVMPDAGFHDELRRLTRETGTLLVLDETHTLVCGPGGLVERWGLEPDMVTIGKSIGGGIPVGAYGMTAELAERFEVDEEQFPASGDFVPELATGGTLFANPLSLAASRAALGEVLTDDAYERTPCARSAGSRTASSRRRRRPGSTGPPTASSPRAATGSALPCRGTRSRRGRRTTSSCAPISGWRSRTGGSGREASGWGLPSPSPWTRPASTATSRSSARCCSSSRPDG